MTQLTLLAPLLAALPTWERVPDFYPGGGKLGTVHIHTRSGWVIHHCGHPTANFPYYILKPDGERVLAPNGRGFQRLELAKQYTEEHHARG
jgi:hypothetical protein